jgi:hypothetical protein
MPAQPTGKGQNRQALFSNQPSGRAAHYFNAAPASTSRHFAEGIQITCICTARQSKSGAFFCKGHARKFWNLMLLKKSRPGDYF